MAYFIERPGDQYYNIGHWSHVDDFPYPIIEAEKVDENTLRVIAPQHIAKSWSQLHPGFYIEVPAFLAGRNLSYEEYQSLFPNIKSGWSDEVMAKIQHVANELDSK